MTVATVLFLSGPNLNLFGQREPSVYGTTTLDEMVDLARETLAKQGHDLEHVQSNHEGALIDAIHGARGRCAALVVNAGALTHSSYALADALATYEGISVELHVSNPSAREAFRRVSVVAPVVTGTIAGFGADGYRLAAEAVAVLLGQAQIGGPGHA
jgi:3-dehydroquinate dehydratase-2